MPKWSFELTVWCESVRSHSVNRQEHHPFPDWGSGDWVPIAQLPFRTTEAKE